MGIRIVPKNRIKQDNLKNLSPEERQLYRTGKGGRSISNKDNASKGGRSISNKDNASKRGRSTSNWNY